MKIRDVLGIATESDRTVERFLLAVVDVVSASVADKLYVMVF